MFHSHKIYYMNKCPNRKNDIKLAKIRFKSSINYKISTNGLAQGTDVCPEARNQFNPKKTSSRQKTHVLTTHTHTDPVTHAGLMKTALRSTGSC